VFSTVPSTSICTVKKVSDFLVPSRGVAYQTPWPGKIKLFPVRESLVSDIPAGDRKIVNLFLQCAVHASTVCL
jgi:hypothetical protein